MLRNNIYKGCCLELMKLISSKSIDMILCDLPYGTTKAKWDSVIDMPKLWEEYERIIKDDGAIVLFAQSPFDKVLACSNLDMYRYEWIWEKTRATGHLNAKLIPMKAHENVLVFYKRRPTYNPQKTSGHKRKVSKSNTTRRSELYNGENKRQHYDSTERYPRTVLKFPTDKVRLHPTQKPLDLIKYFIKTYSNEGDLVLDNCAGSGTTGVGCIELNRDYILMEKDKNIYNDCINRVSSAILKNKSVTNIVDNCDKVMSEKPNTITFF